MTPTATIAASALWSIFALVMLVVIARGYSKYRIDAFREQMFALREQLFDLAAAGDLSFDSAAYGLLRTTMNGFLRFGHRVNIVSLMFFLAFVPEDERELLAQDTPLAKLPAAVHPLAPETQEAIDLLRRQMHAAVLEQLLLGSPWLLLFVVLVAPVFMLPMAGKHLVSRLVSGVYRRYEERLDREFFPVVEGRAYLDGEGIASGELVAA